MDTRYMRTPLGEKEISSREHALDRWERTVLIVVGNGKPLRDLRHDLRKIPCGLEPVLKALVGKGLVRHDPDSQEGMRPKSAAPAAPPSPARRAHRYLSYLIGIIENADAGRALTLTIALRKAASLDEIAALGPLFQESLQAICGDEEAQRLLGKLATEFTDA